MNGIEFKQSKPTCAGTEGAAEGLAATNDAESSATRAHASAVGVPVGAAVIFGVIVTPPVPRKKVWVVGIGGVYTLEVVNDQRFSVSAILILT